MITVFNRKEVYMGFSEGEYLRTKDALSAAGIHYLWKIQKSAAGAHASRGTGCGDSFEHLYAIYVDRRDLDRARQVIRGGGR